MHIANAGSDPGYGDYGYRVERFIDKEDPSPESDMGVEYSQYKHCDHMSEVYGKRYKDKQKHTPWARRNDQGVFIGNPRTRPSNHLELGEAAYDVADVTHRQEQSHSPCAQTIADYC